MIKKGILVFILKLACVLSQLSLCLPLPGCEMGTFYCLSGILRASKDSVQFSEKGIVLNTKICHISKERKGHFFCILILTYDGIESIKKVTY